MPAISVGDIFITEGDSGTKLATVTVTLDQAPVTGQTVNVNYATSDGSATLADADYAASSGTLSFAAGETSKTFTVTLNHQHQ